jgi:N-acetylmuramoyl-L-alanine amidase
MPKIMIDPGHGGTDPGAVANGLTEAALNLSLALDIRRILTTEYEGAEIKMTRETDVFVTLGERARLANEWGADYFVSIHHNASASHVYYGFETYVHDNASTASIAYQNVMHSTIMQAMGDQAMKDLGKKRANFAVLRETNMPAILTENGFLDHNIDAAKLKTTSFKDALARGHANGLAQALGIKKKPSVYEFKDVTQDHWAYQAIIEAARKGFISGFPDGTFKPDQPLTRAQMAAILQRLG